MKASLYLTTVGVMIALTACSTQEVKPTAPAAAVANPPSQPSPATPPQSGPNPALTIDKGGKKLNLVRIMDGTACKNDMEGVKGSFLVYADLNDIERIKRQQGTKIFSDFENKIQAFSAEVLQQAVNATNLDENPFALGKDESQEQLAKQLSSNFQQAATAPITKFEKETSLTIDVTAYAPSLEFYQQGCQAALNDSQAPDNP